MAKDDQSFEEGNKDVEELFDFEFEELPDEGQAGEEASAGGTEEDLIELTEVVEQQEDAGQEMASSDAEEAGPELETRSFERGDDFLQGRGGGDQELEVPIDLTTELDSALEGLTRESEESDLGLDDIELDKLRDEERREEARLGPEPEQEPAADAEAASSPEETPEYGGIAGVSEEDRAWTEPGSEEFAGPEKTPGEEAVGVSGISEEQLEAAVRKVVEDVIERVARETMADVAEKVITQAIDALKESLESRQE